jgi:hypothetical protein
MTFGELLIKINEQLANEYLTDSIDNYEIVFKKLRPDFKYDYYPIEIDRIDHKLKTIIIEKEIK